MLCLKYASLYEKGEKYSRRTKNSHKGEEKKGIFFFKINMCNIYPSVKVLQSKVHLWFSFFWIENMTHLSFRFTSVC